jgi:hypothetical protein
MLAGRLVKHFNADQAVRAVQVGCSLRRRSRWSFAADTSLDGRLLAFLRSDIDSIVSYETFATTFVPPRPEAPAYSRFRHSRNK